jgi:hypothetical protein
VQISVGVSFWNHIYTVPKVSLYIQENTALLTVYYDNLEGFWDSVREWKIFAWMSYKTQKHEFL